MFDDRPPSPKESMTAAETTPRVSAHDKLLAAANELFYTEGIHTVGVDRIIEHAGVSRASFYNNFDSKEHLIHTYLLGRHDRTTGHLSRAIESAQDGRGKVLAVFDAQAEQLRQPGFNGCAFVAASTEAPEGGLIDHDAEEFRTWIRTMFTQLAEKAGAPDPQKLGEQLHVLYDGAALAVRMDHDPAIAQAVRAAVTTLLDATTTKQG
jgi:AcrR family transcriptional regulator